MIDSMMDPNIVRALESAYGFPISPEPYGNGHINGTYLLRGEPLRVLQRINTSVFTDPDALMKNYVTVTTFLQKKITAAGGDPARETVNVIPTKDGRPYTEALKGCYRVIAFVEDAFCLDLAENPAQMREAGCGFGHFQKMLADFPASDLYEVLPNFHHTPTRYAQLCDAVKRNASGRLSEVAAELAFVEERRPILSVITDDLKNGKIPLRVTHNDTKINNILFDRATGRAICVIDLDTVMPGSLLYDFGDAIRAGAATAAEDERDLSKVGVDPVLYRAFRDGFLEEVGESITERERELLPFSARLLTLECGMRFLADHLNGDTYFRVSRPGQNLDRARTQFRMVRIMEDLEDEFRKF